MMMMMRELRHMIMINTSNVMTNVTYSVMRTGVVATGVVATGVVTSSVATYFTKRLGKKEFSLKI